MFLTIFAFGPFVLLDVRHYLRSTLFSEREFARENLSFVSDSINHIQKYATDLPAETCKVKNITLTSRTSTFKVEAGRIDHFRRAPESLRVPIWTACGSDVGKIGQPKISQLNCEVVN